MKRLVPILLLLLALACADEQKPSPGEAAKQAAQECYDHLLVGRYDMFVNGRVGSDSLPQSYREQLTTACKQFMAQQRVAHGGIASFQVSNVRVDSTQNLVQVFLVLQYGDATQEEIVVPMVMYNGEWKMK